MKRISSFFFKLIVLQFVIILNESAIAHETDEVRLPPYDEGQATGYATLRITEVAGNYIIAFGSSQFNFMKTESVELRDPLLAMQREEILNELQQASSIFNSEDFACQMVMKPNVVSQLRLRQKNPDMSMRYVKSKEQSQFTERFNHVTAQYKLQCQQAIEFDKLELRIFKSAPHLETLLLKIASEKNGTFEQQVVRSQVMEK